MTASPCRRTLPAGLTVLACFIAAGLSLLWAHQPSFDPWSWLVWGRELSGVSLSGFDTGGPSGWKPLPVIVSLPFNWISADAAPIAWLWLQRTAMLLIPFAGWRLGRIAAGVTGGASAFALTLLLPGVLNYAGGVTEPIVALGLMMGVAWAAEGREEKAWLAGLIAVLGRPEALAAVLPWGIWAALRRRISWLWIAVGLSVGFFLWVIGDWISNGKPFALLGKADKGAEPRVIQQAASPAFEMIGRLDASAAISLVALAAFVAAWIWRERVSELLGLAILVTGASILVATQLGYPGVPRYLVPVLSPIYALAGIGVGRAAGLLRRGWQRTAVATVMTAVLFALAAPGAWRSDQASYNWYHGRLRDERGIPGIIAAVGGRGAVLGCGAYSIEPPAEASALAWQLDVGLRQVGRSGINDLHEWRPPTIIFVADKRLARFKRKTAERRLVWRQLARRQGWTAFAVARSTDDLCAR